MRDAKDAKRIGKHDRFRRTEETVDARPVFFIASEGKNTEPDYFENVLAGLYRNIRIVSLKEKNKKGAVRGNDPKKLKQRIQEKLRGPLKKSIAYEAWVVLDRDEKTWTIEQLNEVAMWIKAENSKENSAFHGMALSNPCFEFWLLLHFEEGKGALDNDKCISRLKNRIPSYDKKLDASSVIKLFTEEAIKGAIKRSKAKNKSLCLNEDWPREPGHTTVHILVQRILNAAGKIPR